jgi:hypothetical protein
MKVNFTYTAHVLGTPTNGRKVRSIKSKVTTQVEIAELSLSDAPAVYEIEKRYKTGFTHFFDGGYYSLRNDDPWSKDDINRCGLSQELVFDHAHFAGIEAHIDLHRFDDSNVDARGDGITTPLDQSFFREIDADVMAEFEEAAHKIASNMVFIDAHLHFRCFEPCIIVSWEEPKPVDAFTWQPPTRILVADGHADTFRPFADAVPPPPREDIGYEPFKDGLTGLGRYGFFRDGFKERRFSVNDSDGIADFVRHLKSKSRNGGTMMGSGPELKVLRPEFTSAHFEQEEVGRSARDLVTCMTGLVNGCLGPAGKVKVDRFSAQIETLSTAISAHDRREITGEMLAAAVDTTRSEVEQLMRGVRNRNFRPLEDCLGPRPFWRFDALPIDLNIGGPGLPHF